MVKKKNEDSNDTMKGRFGVSGGLYKAFGGMELTPMESISAKQSLGGMESREVMSSDQINFKNKDAEKMNSNPSMAGENGEFEVPTTGMRTNDPYFNLGMSLRERVEKKAKSEGFSSYSDKKAKKKEERKKDRSKRKSKRNSKK